MRTGAKVISLKRIYPLLAAFDDVVVSKKGAISCGWEVDLPVAYSCGEQEYDGMVEAVASALRALAPWTVVHRQDLYLYEECNPEDMPGDGFLKRSYNARFRGVRHLTHHSYIFITFANKQLVEKPGGSSGLFGIGVPAKIPELKEFEMFLLRATQFKSIVENSGIRLRPLTGDEWVGTEGAPGLIQSYMMLGDSSTVMSDVSFTSESVSVHDRTALVFNIAESRCLPSEVSNVTRVEALSNTAGDIILSAGSRLGTGLDCEHCVNQIFVVPPRSEILSDMASEKKDMTTGLDSTDNRLNAEEIGTYLDAAYKEGLVTVKTQTNLIVWGRDGDQLQLVGKATAALAAMNIDLNSTAVYCRHNAPVIWYACVPGNAYEIGEESLMKQELRSNLCLGVYETFERGIPGGILSLCDRIRHVPFQFDIQEVARLRGYIDNFNAFVLGGSGAGKSYLMNMLLRQMYDADEHVFFIDVGDSYEGLCAIIREESDGKDGQYMKWDPQRPLTFSLFQDYTTWTDEDGRITQDLTDYNFVMTWFQQAWTPEGGWSDVAVSILRKIILDFLVKMRRDGVAHPIFDDFFSYLQNDVQPRIQYKGMTEADFRARHLNEEVGKIRKRKQALDENVMRRLEVEADAWVVQNRDVIRDRIWDDIMLHGYTMNNRQVTLSLFNVEDFVTTLTAWESGGIYGGVLNSPEPADFTKTRFVGFEVSSISNVKDFYPLCVLLITHTFDTKMRRDVGPFKVLLIDEAWKAIANETMAPYLQELFKTSRKYNASGIVASQEIADIESSEVVKTAIIQNSSVKILLSQEGNQKSFELVADMLSLDDRQRALVMSINKGRDLTLGEYREACFILGGRLCLVAAIITSLQESFAYESKKDRKEKTFNLARQFDGSIIKAIRVRAGENIK